MNTKPNQSTGLVSIEQHNRLTAGPADWTATRIAEDQFQIARAVFGTSSEDDDKRVYRTLQAYEWKRTHANSPHGEYIASRAPAAPAQAVPLTDEQIAALRRLWPAIEKGMGCLVFTAEQAGAVQADMNTVQRGITPKAAQEKNND